MILSQNSLNVVTRSQITIIFSYLIGIRKLNSNQLYDRVDTRLLAWLRSPHLFGSDLRANFSIQRPSYVKRVAMLIVSGDLDVNADYEPIGRFLSWVNNWDPKRKLQLKSILSSLKQDYPESDLWDIVEFPT